MSATGRTRTCNETNPVDYRVAGFGFRASDGALVHTMASPAAGDTIVNGIRLDSAGRVYLVPSGIDSSEVVLGGLRLTNLDRLTFSNGNPTHFEQGLGITSTAPSNSGNLAVEIVA